MIDRQGRLNLTQKLCKLCNYTGLMKVWLVRENDKTFRIVPEDNLCTDMKFVASAIIDEKNRLIVPKAVRSHYTEETLVYGDAEEGFIYIRFFDRAQEVKTIDQSGRLALTKDLCELCGYDNGMQVWFAVENETTYRIVRAGERFEGYKIVAPAKIDEKGRVFVPKAIREHYTSEAMVYATLDKRHIFVSFFDRANTTAGTTKAES